MTVSQFFSRAAFTGLMLSLADCTMPPTGQGGTADSATPLHDAGPLDAASVRDAAADGGARDATGSDAARDASPPADAARPDAQTTDAAGPHDGAVLDAHHADAADASAADAGVRDATTAVDAAPRPDATPVLDAAVVDAAKPDASHPDSAVNNDAATPDAAAEDGGTADAAFADAGSPDAAGTDAAGTDAAGTDAAGTDAAVATQHIRIMAANLTAGNNQNYNTPPGDVAPGPGIRIMQGVQPDVVLVQEMRFGTDNAAGMQQFADLVLGEGSYWCRETVDGPGDLPNGFISRFQILDCGEWRDSRVTNRDYAYARIDVPGPVDLWAISVHLHTQALSRPIEGAEIILQIQANVPPEVFLVVGGDLNTDSADPLLEPIFDALDDELVLRPQPADQFGNKATNTNRLITYPDGGWDVSRNKPYDWVIPDADLLAREVPVVLTNGTVTLTFPSGMVVDTRVFDSTTLPLIAPARATDSSATNMQHMGVVREFALPLQ